MAETEAIQKMAEKISKEIFSEFFWELFGPKNANWKCDEPAHEKATHPSDVVFSYQEPYKDLTTYLNFDLKSYAKDTIVRRPIESAIRSLISATSCAQTSEDWAKKFTSNSGNYEVSGALFVYNHDDEYDKEFSKNISGFKREDIKVPKDSKIFIIGPKEIFKLHNIASDLKIMRGDERLPSKNLYTFYYPQLLNRKIVPVNKRFAATAELLTSGWIPIKYSENKKDLNDFSMLIYYTRNGDGADEFVYLIDYLFSFQLIESARKIIIKLVNPCDGAIANLNRAKSRYFLANHSSSDIQLKLEKIEAETITNIVKNFSLEEIGLE